MEMDFFGCWFFRALRLWSQNPAHTIYPYTRQLTRFGSEPYKCIEVQLPFTHTHIQKSYKRPTTDAKKFVTRKKYVFYLSPLFCCYYKSVYCKNEIYKNTMYIVNTHSCRLSSIIISSERNFWISSHEMGKSLDVVTVATRQFYEPCILRRKVSWFQHRRRPDFFRTV
jgi:hypothetical protein